ncbi:UbiX family flavin prenyltransferase [Myxococcota bacterium]|nr:UbiX family flavin prenyltransferase [Myxococcota bacterium]
MASHRVVIAVTGASGVLLGRHCLEICSTLPSVETHLVVTDAAKKVIVHELGKGALEEFTGLATVCHPQERVEAHIASGSFDTAGMVIAPCSLHTAMALSAGLGGNLVERAGQVHLKERRPLVLVLRESPLAAHHLTHLAQLAGAGAVIMPASPRFYLFPTSMDNMVKDMALKALSYLALPGLPRAEYTPTES